MEQNVALAIQAKGAILNAPGLLTGMQVSSAPQRLEYLSQFAIGLCRKAFRDSTGFFGFSLIQPPERNLRASLLTLLIPSPSF